MLAEMSFLLCAPLLHVITRLFLLYYFINTIVIIVDIILMLVYTSVWLFV